MKHIFYCHSSICIITIYETVKKLSDYNEDIIIILARGAKWFYNLRNVEVIDITDKKCLFDVIHIRTLKKILLAHKNYAEMDRMVSNIVGERDFLLYIPVIEPFSISFIRNKHCLGYYFIEEGILSYQPLQAVRKKRNRNFLFIAKFIGIRYYNFYTRFSTFKGTLAINNKAFPWNIYKERVVNRIDNVPLQTSDSYNICYNIIVFSNLFYKSLKHYSLADYCKAIDFTISQISNSNNIAIKFHPRTPHLEKEMMDEILRYVHTNYANITILPDEFSIELNVLNYHSKVFCVFIKSSVFNYSKMFNEQSFFIGYNKEKLIITE